MLSHRKIILYGGGEMALEVAAFIIDANAVARTNEWQTAALVTDVIDQSSEMSADLCGALDSNTQIHRDHRSIEDLAKKEVLICIGDATARDRVFTELDGLADGPKFATLIHPTSYVAPGVTLGRGVIVAPLAYVGPGARLGDNVFVNVHATVGHHVSLGRSAVISPQADINGRTRLGRVVFVGAGAVLAPRSSIGPYSKVANGAIFSGNCGGGFLLAGNPAKGRQMFKIPEESIS